MEQVAAKSSFLPFQLSAEKQQHGCKLHTAQGGGFASTPGHLSQKPNYRLSMGSRLAD